jgi:hypothetical protein
VLGGDKSKRLLFSPAGGEERWKEKFKSTPSLYALSRGVEREREEDEKI